MPVALVPPLTGSGGDWQGQMPLTTAARYVRGPGNSRWHRARAAVVYPADTFPWEAQDRTSVTLWCGQHASDTPARPLLWADEVPSGDPVCGTCVGRALGAGQDETPTGLPPLVFHPRWVTPPRWCPGSGRSQLWRKVGRGDAAGVCMACGEAVPIRARRYPGWGYGMQQHLPGPALVEPCPFHAWQRLVERQGKVRCGCGWPYDLKARPG